MVLILISVSLSEDLSVLNSRNLLKGMMLDGSSSFPFGDRNQKLLVDCFFSFHRIQTEKRVNILHRLDLEQNLETRLEFSFKASAVTDRIF